jgi:flagellar operon protein
MAMDKMTGMTGSVGIGPLQPGDLKKSSNGSASPAAGAEFKKALEQFAPTAGLGSANGATGATATPAAGALEKLKFSNHAVERMRSRGINFSPDEMKNIEGAISKASAKGAKDTLVLSGDNALIVSVKNNTVVTVMDKAAMKDNVFTNIDSTVVV